jgi:hypothetical protein
MYNILIPHALRALALRVRALGVRALGALALALRVRAIVVLVTEDDRQLPDGVLLAGEAVLRRVCQRKNDLKNNPAPAQSSRSCGYRHDHSSNKQVWALQNNSARELRGSFIIIIIIYSNIQEFFFSLIKAGVWQ